MHGTHLPTIGLNDLAGGPGTLVLTGNPRLAQALIREHGRLRASLGLRRWETLRCLTVPQWLETVRSDWLLLGDLPDGVLARRALSPAQERLVWERVIRDDVAASSDPTLFDLQGLAASAQEAHELQVTWGVQTRTTTPVEEHRRYQRWRHAFMGWCETHGWATPRELDHATVNALIVQPWSPSGPRQVVLAGFHRLDPITARLISALPGRGVDSRRLDDHVPAEALTASGHPDADAELAAAAQWIREQVQQDRGARIALVVSDLAERRDRVGNALEHALAPALARPAYAEKLRPFNISLGRPLADHPVAAAALLLLDALSGGQEADTHNRRLLWLHPYWCSPETAPVRASLDAQMRRELPPDAGWTRIAAWIHNPTRGQPDGLQAVQKAVSMIGQTLKDNLGRAQPSWWSTWIRDRLPTAGWLQGRRLTSHEYQTKEAFEACVAELARLDPFLGDVSLSDACQRLRQLCRERIFQPQTEGQPTIEVLGLLEASGQRFDAVWVMGLTASVWPPAARPNPLLPAEAQRQANSPNADATVQLAFASAVHGQLLRSAPRVMLSHARMDGSAELAPSPLLSPVPIPPMDRVMPLPRWPHDALARKGGRLSPPILDAMAPAVPPGGTVSGGTALLKAQAICPAWAFYRYRLGAAALEEAPDPLDPRPRGQLLHRAMEHLWTHLRDSHSLQRLDDTGQAAIVQAAVTHALDSAIEQPPHEPLSERTRALESRRLTRLISGWLAIERQRSHAFTVIATERRETLDLAGLSIRVQIDRIDRLDDGQQLVIDYKTGAQVDTGSWAKPRITEPQLPLYAALSGHANAPVTGALFAKVVLKDPGWAGLTADPLGLGGAPSLDSTWGRKRYPAEDYPTWDSLLTRWRERLESIAQEIQQGDARVQCLDEKALAHCDVLPLLRLSERRAQWLAMNTNRYQEPSP